VVLIPIPAGVTVKLGLLIKLAGRTNHHTGHVPQLPELPRNSRAGFWG